MKTRLFSMAVLLLTVLLTAITSCEKDDSTSVSDCEKNHTGDITIINHRPFTVSVKLGSDKIVGEFTELRTVAPDDSTIYQKIPIGVIDVYCTDDSGNMLLVNNETIKQCENVRFFLWWW